MDKKIMQHMIYEIIETEEYNLEGIAYYTRIPLDVIIEVACGNNINLSVTPWLKIMELYLEVKPEISHALLDTFFELRKNDINSPIL